MSQIVSSMAGTVFQVLVSVGETVSDGQDVVILESMKMEVPVSADATGTIQKIHVEPGDFVNEGDVLIDLE
jgi:acetyl-CoA carboxylase biotin carboxyl carrier protein